jgi:hypothetical protein
MKSMLYIGATLMIGATIYGFVDLRKTNQRGELKNLYHEAEIKPPTENASTIIEETKLDAKEAESRVVNLEKKVVTEGESKKQEAVHKKSEHKKGVSYKKFSRAALREDVVQPEVPATPVVKKTEVTEKAPEKK